MKDFTAKHPDRHYTEMFYVDTSQLTVDRVQAFSCPPNDDDDMRWVPEKGYSVSVGWTVFNTEVEARQRFREVLQKERVALETRLERVGETLAELKR